MKHALISLREELLALEGALDILESDPSAAGRLSDAKRMAAQLKLEAAEVREAISYLQSAQMFEGRAAA